MRYDKNNAYNIIHIVLGLLLSVITILILLSTKFQLENYLSLSLIILFPLIYLSNKNSNLRSIKVSSIAILGFSGKLGSDRSKHSQSIQNVLPPEKWHFASFSKYIKNEARLRNIKFTLQNLQNLGETLIQEMGWFEFCKSMLDYSNYNYKSNLIVDSIRHVEARSNLIKVIKIPNQFMWLYINSTSNYENNEIKNHSTEIQLTGFIEDKVDIIIHNSLENDGLLYSYQAITNWLTGLNQSSLLVN